MLTTIIMIGLVAIKIKFINMTYWDQMDRMYCNNKYNKYIYCPYVPRLGIITAENRQKYSAILYLVSCSLTPK